MKPFRVAGGGLGWRVAATGGGWQEDSIFGSQVSADRVSGTGYQVRVRVRART